MNKILSTLMASVMVLAPTGVGAATYAERQEHLELYNALEEVNISVYANPEMCDPKEGFLGFYAPSHRLISICQKDPTVQFNDEDLDTLRHEAHHVVQDCLDGKIDGELSLLFTGEAKEKFLENYPMSKQLRVRRVYGEAGTDAHIIEVEVEAFAVAEMVGADVIAQAVRNACAGK